MGTRHRFTPDYHRDVATLVLDSGSSIASMTRDLGLGETVVGQWIKIERERRQAAAGPPRRGRGPHQTPGDGLDAYPGAAEDPADPRESGGNRPLAISADV